MAPSRGLFAATAKCYRARRGPNAQEGEMPKLVMLAIALLALLAAPAFAQQVPQGREQIQLSFATVVKQTAPAVVNVYAKRVVRQPGIPGFSDDPFFRRFFGDGGAFGRSREMVQNSLGSGVLVDPNGIVVT